MTAIPEHTNRKNHRTALQPQIKRGGIIIHLLSFVLVAASISRIPIFDQIEEVKIALFGAEALAVALLLTTLRHRSSPIAIMAILAMLILMRFMFGAFIANASFHQAFTASAQEARFGLMLVATPLAYYLFKNTSNITLKKFVTSYLIILATLDISLYTALASENLLVLGLRTDNRFVCSVLIPLVCVALVAIRNKGEENREAFAILASMVMVLHTYLVTTSRIEMALATGILGFSIQSRWPSSRWLQYAILLIGTTYFVANLRVTETNIGGRDFPIAFEMVKNGLPWGHGSVTDITARNWLGLPEQFFFSDYGLLLYVMRYGLLGIAMVIMLMLLWLHFALASSRLNGWIFLTIPTLAYLTFIPLLDYGSLNGGFLLAFMLIVPAAIKQQKESEYE